jgi:hypothetical protein
MNCRQPPALASWLLDWLGYTGQNPALAGDMLEEFRNGRSPAWYWRQTLMVIATGIARNAFVLRRFLAALVGGFAAQAAVAFGLWSLHAPPRIHGVVWAIVASLLWLIVVVLHALVKRRISGGPATADLRLLFGSSGVASSRNPQAIMALVVFEAFAIYLPAYCICALFLKPFSSGTLALWELGWFVLFVLPSALVRVPGARRTKAMKIEDYRQLSLLVTCAGGQTILMRPETVVESIFAAGDEKLASVLFSRGASVEVLRRAIWLGCHWTRTPPINLNDFLFLVDEAKRKECKS